MILQWLIFEKKPKSIKAGNLNSSLTYFITTVSFSNFGKEADDCKSFSEIFKNTYLSIVKGSESQQIM